MIINVASPKRIKQKEGHCGPASLVMLLSVYGYNVTQGELVEAAGISQTIKEKGSRIDQLASSIECLYPDLILLAKYNTSIEDVVGIISLFRVPVGVEWQGGFLDSRLGHFEEGHYSLVTGVNLTDQTITLIDPDPRSALDNGTLLIEEFESRWWDNNEVPREDRLDTVETIRNERLLFVIIPKVAVASFRPFSLAPATLSMMREYSIEEMSHMIHK